MIKNDNKLIFKLIYYYDKKMIKNDNKLIFKLIYNTKIKLYNMII